MLIERYSGVRAAFVYKNCASLARVLHRITPTWPTEGLDTIPKNHISVLVQRRGKAYEVRSPWLDHPYFYRSATTAASDLLSQLFWYRLSSRPNDLSLHCAAVMFGRRLVLFPAVYRAGKSTLTAALAQRGHRVFCDDVLWVAKADLRARAHGVPPRLRLPLPLRSPPGLKSFVRQQAILSNGRHVYVHPGEAQLAPFGARAKIGGIVLLNRHYPAHARLEAADPAEALRTLLQRNAARDDVASKLFATARELIASRPCLKMTYYDLGEAMDSLEDYFAAPARQSTEPAVAKIGAGGVDVGSSRFLLDDQTGRISQMNATARAIVEAARQGLSEDEILDLFHSAFPEIGKRRLRQDIRQILEKTN